jgi:hypothetical protein
MNAWPVSRGLAARALIPSLALVLALAASAYGPPPSGAVAAEPSGDPAALVSPEPTSTPAESLCRSAEDLRLIVDFLRGTSLSEDGIVPVLVGTIAALSEARRLAGFVEETYRPLVDDLIAALQGLRTALDEFQDRGTFGAAIATIGEAVTEIGLAMDALGTALREPCPTDVPAASAAPSASAVPPVSEAPAG